MTRIDTESELDALPVGSVIVDQFVVVSERGYSGWFTTGVEEPDPPHLPATLLHIPGRDLVQEAQANAWDQGYARGFYSATPSPDASENPYRDEAP